MRHDGVILTELGSSLRATTNAKQVLEPMTAQIQQALYAANATILRNGQHDFQSACRAIITNARSHRGDDREPVFAGRRGLSQRIHTIAQPA